MKRVHVLLTMPVILMLGVHLSSALAADAPPPANAVTCGNNDFTCIINAAQGCSPAIEPKTDTVNVFAIQKTNQSHLILLGMNDGGRCAFTMTLDSVKISIPPEMAQEAKAKGATDDQLMQMQLTARAQAQKTIGGTDACSLPPQELVALLTKWSQGNFSSGDLASANCTTTLADGTSPAK